MRRRHAGGKLRQLDLEKRSLLDKSAKTQNEDLSSPNQIVLFRTAWISEILSIRFY